MPDILAIVSKAVFEKDAAGLGVGAIWPTAAYVSANKGLAPLADGGALFLVTVRPDRVLWLVAVLDRPTSSRGAWRATANTVPITDITALIPSIRFASGKGLVRDDKLGMSLQTPRGLAADTAAALRARATGAPAVAASAPAPTLPAPPPRSGKPAKRAKAAAPAAPAAPSIPRPPGVPDAATWDAADESWELGERDADGSRQGLWRYWRGDGRLRCECPYRDDEPAGINRRYHPDGTIASEGTWIDGRLHDCVYYRATTETDEQPIPEGGPATVRALYASTDGRSNATIRYFDAEGRQRDRAGELVPPPPAGLPVTARYFSDEDFHPPDGSLGGWVDGAIARGTQGKVGTWRWWSTAGLLLRTERYTDRGKTLAIVPLGEPDPVETTLARFYAGEEKARYDTRRIWTPAVHDEIRARLGTLPAPITREYIALLHADIEEYYRIWTAKVPQPSRIVEVVDDWDARTANDPTDIEAWYILAAGARAALELRDKRRLARWWKRVEAIPIPKEKDWPSTYPFNHMSHELGKKGELRGKITDFLAGVADKELARIRTALAATATAAAVTDDELAALAAVEVGCTEPEVMIRDRATREAWLRDGENRSHHYDGNKFTASEVVFDARAPHDLEYVSPHDKCDERLVLWPGKHGWLVLQRYGRAVLWHQATYYTSRGQAEVTRICWFKAGSPVQAQRMMGLIQAAQSKGSRAIDPWFDSKLGVIVRGYTGHGLTGVGVHDNVLTTGKRVVERLATHEEAVAAFEKLEIERLRSGSVLTRFRAVKPGDDDG